MEYSPKQIQELRQALNQHRAQQARKGSLVHFVDLIRSTDYSWNFHHVELVRKLQAWVRGDITRLMVSMPPRHGKSELVSRLLPAFIFGLYPSAKLIACSYSASLASDMNADVQRVMISPEYALAFPSSTLNSRNVVTLTQPKRNSTRFDIVGNTGYYLCAGVQGPITGKGFNFGIIDDPIKNQQEAESELIRKRVYDWFNSVFYTRIENSRQVGPGRILITQTRWHEDDLAGRLLEQQAEAHADKWTVVSFPAIAHSNEEHRKAGEALWPDKFSLQDLQTIKQQLGSRYWAALYQQEPAAQEGSIFRRSWFQRYSAVTPGTMNFYLDTAYTKDARNDRTGIIAYWSAAGNVYVHHAEAVRLEFPELVRFIQDYTARNGYSQSSRIYVEPKASGLSIVQQLRRETRLNVVADKPPRDSKVSRAQAITAKVEAGRVLLPEAGSWVDLLIDELCSFPTARHDDLVDCLVGAVNTSQRSSGVRMRGRSIGG